MRKNLTKLLSEGDLTPKERILLLIESIVSEETTGKKILNEAEEKALSENWTAKDNNEVAEWNKYNGAWNYVRYMETDGQTYYLKSLLAFCRIRVVLNYFNFYPMTHRAEQGVEMIKKVKKVSGKEAIEILAKARNKQLKNGFKFDYAIYRLAFELLCSEDQEAMILLYGDVEFDRQWLDEEEEISELIKAKDYKGIAKRVANKSYNKHTKEYSFLGYYACIPVEEIAKRWLDKNKRFKENYIKDIDYETVYPNPNKKASEELIKKVAEREGKTKEETKEQMIIFGTMTKMIKKYADENKTTIEEVLKKVCLEWLNNGLLDDYEILATSDHKELFDKWLASRKTAQEKLNKHIKDRKFATKEENGQRIITGDSLYNCDLDYSFIKDYKKIVDNYDPSVDGELLIASEKPLSIFDQGLSMVNTGIWGLLEEKKEGGKTLIDFKDDQANSKKMLKDTRNKGLDYYTTLLKMNTILEELSKVYEIDISYTIKGYIKEIEALIEEYNNLLDMALYNFIDDEKVRELKDQSLYIDLDEVKARPVVDNNLAMYYKEFKDRLGSEYKGQPL